MCTCSQDRIDGSTRWCAVVPHSGSNTSLHSMLGPMLYILTQPSNFVLGPPSSHTATGTPPPDSVVDPPPLTGRAQATADGTSRGKRAAAEVHDGLSEKLGRHGERHCNCCVYYICALNPAGLLFHADHGSVSSSSSHRPSYATHQQDDFPSPTSAHTDDHSLDSAGGYDVHRGGTECDEFAHTGGDAESSWSQGSQAVSTVKPQITARGRLSLLPSQDRPRQLHTSRSFQSSLVPTEATLASNVAHNASTHAVHVSPLTSASTGANRAYSSVMVTPQNNASSAAHEEPLQRLERQVQDCNERIRQLEERLRLMEEKQRGDNTAAPH
jgi:hypothetical protein